MVWTEYELALLTDYLFETNLSTWEIAQEFGCSELEVKKAIRNMGLSWVSRRKGHLSRGQAALTSIMRKLLPGQEVRTEEPIGERLRLDIYCPSYQLAAEYHGRQHFTYIEHFHGNLDGFKESQRRDARKEKICEDLGITLIAFRFNDSLTEDSVYERMIDALRDGTPLVRQERRSEKGEPHYEAWMQRQREYRKEAYRRMKQRGRG